MVDLVEGNSTKPMVNPYGKTIPKDAYKVRVRSRVMVRSRVRVRLGLGLELGLGLAIPKVAYKVRG